MQRPASCAEAATGAAPPITPTNAPSRRVHVRINGARCSFQPLVATFSVQSSPPTAAVAAPATRPRQSQVAQHQPTSPPPPFPESLGGAFGGFFTARRLPGNEDEVTIMPPEVRIDDEVMEYGQVQMETCLDEKHMRIVADLPEPKDEDMEEITTTGGRGQPVELVGPESQT